MLIISTDAYHIFRWKQSESFRLVFWNTVNITMAVHPTLIGQQNLLLVSNCNVIPIYPIPPYLYTPQPQGTLISLRSFRSTSHFTCQCLYLYYFIQCNDLYSAKIVANQDFILILNDRIIFQYACLYSCGSMEVQLDQGSLSQCTLRVKPPWSHPLLNSRLQPKDMIQTFTSVLHHAHLVSHFFFLDILDSPLFSLPFLLKFKNKYATISWCCTTCDF